jgi:hypothetical protein
MGRFFRVSGGCGFSKLGSWMRRPDLRSISEMGTQSFQSRLYNFQPM